MEKTYVIADTPKVSRYIKLYKGMLEYAAMLQLNLVAIMLYTLLLSRATLSNRNGWRDEQGRIYVIMPRDEAAKALGCTKGSALKAFRALIKAGLLTEQPRVNRKHCTIAPYLYPKQWGCPGPRLSIEQIMAGELPYLTSSNISVISDAYLELPTELVERQDITLRAKMLYAIVLDITKLSVDHGRCDSDGRYWCEIDATRAQAMLGCGHAALSDAYKELSTARLITRVRVEYGCGMRTYLHPCWGGNQIDGVREDITPNCLTDTPQISEVEEDNHLDFAPQVAEKTTQVNSINLSPHNYQQGGSICACPRDAAAKRFREQILADAIIRDWVLLPDGAHRLAILSLAIDVMTDDSLSAARRFQVGDAYVNRADLLAEYDSIDCETMRVLIGHVAQIWTTIRKPVPYLRRALYTARDDHFDEIEYRHVFR